MLQYKTGDILDATEQYIVHQCNCVSRFPAGLAKAIFDKYTFADEYILRDVLGAAVPGSISVFEPAWGETGVINLYGQYYPGSPRFPGGKLDGYEARKRYFCEGLVEIEKIPNLKSLAFPYMIGCGLAGGAWHSYEIFLQSFATQNYNIDVVVYQLPV